MSSTSHDSSVFAWTVSPGSGATISPVLWMDIAACFSQPEQWIDLPNAWLGGRTPRELLGTQDEQLVLDLIEGIKHGVTA